MDSRLVRAKGLSPKDISDYPKRLPRHRTENGQAQDSITFFSVGTPDVLVPMEKERKQ
ncbi:hypothetical protein [Sphingobacterium alkalisoli]|uniref:hypothetical protein n=1 Tax=Sphingobacterium alkalisoli TaxID=1874115 RepID=UPI00145F8F5B|nr:hypothetical protein [Sphingobacterium alkalisoli]